MEKNRMTAPAGAHTHAKEPWSVNAIDSKRGRITGDETSAGWDRLHINAQNCTVARCDKPADARRIVACVNAFAGIPTDAIRNAEMESAIYRGENAALRAERDSLRAALRAQIEPRAKGWKVTDWDIRDEQARAALDRGAK